VQTILDMLYAGAFGLCLFMAKQKELPKFVKGHL